MVFRTWNIVCKEALFFYREKVIAVDADHYASGLYASQSLRYATSAATDIVAVYGIRQIPI